MGQSDLSFAQLVSELDAAEGGEALTCLVPRKVDPPPGAWMHQQRPSINANGFASAGAAQTQQTWGQIMSKPTGGALRPVTPMGGAGYVSAAAT